MNQLLDAVRRRTDEIVSVLAPLHDDDLHAPSALPNWSRLTIACHLRYGATAFRRMTFAALSGKAAAYYPDGRQAQRDGTLTPAAGEGPHDVVASLRDESAALDDVWRTCVGADWGRDVVEPADNTDLGTRPLGALVLSRLTEVEVHATDLDLGLADWNRVFVSAALPFRLDWLNRRRSNHRTVDPTVHGSWLLVATDGPAWHVTVDGGGVEAHEATPGEPADAVIEGTGRDLLALLLGRPTAAPLQFGGDAALAAAFSRAFPGP